jgi:hypothetical protein
MLGTLTLPSPVVLVWHAAGGTTQIFTSSGFMLVNSTAPLGSVRLTPGSYPHLRVASRAGWSIELQSPTR